MNQIAIGITISAQRVYLPRNPIFGEVSIV